MQESASKDYKTHNQELVVQDEAKALVQVEEMLQAAAASLGEAQSLIFGEDTTAPRGFKALAMQIQYANNRVQTALDECALKQPR